MGTHAHTHTHTHPWVSIWFEGISGPSEDDQLECRKKILEFIFKLKLKKKKKHYGEFHGGPLMSSQRADRLKPQSQIMSQSDHTDHSLV